MLEPSHQDTAHHGSSREDLAGAMKIRWSLLKVDAPRPAWPLWSFVIASQHHSTSIAIDLATSASSSTELVCISRDLGERGGSRIGDDGDDDSRIRDVEEM